jgi:hypothetical protein
MTLQNPLLDFAIGMIVFFLTASLLVTALQEAIAQLLDLRAKTLKAAIGRMLDDSNTGGPNTDAFFDHPLIRSLNARAGKSGSSYIPASIFSTALGQVVQAAQGTGSFLAAAAALRSSANGGNVLDSTLKAIADDVGQNSVLFERAVEDWFDAVMDRVSGLYKRKTQAMAFVFGLIVAALFNLNALTVAGYLAANPSASKAMADAAMAYVQNQPNLDLSKQEARTKLLADLSDIGAKGRVPIGWPVAKNVTDMSMFDQARHIFWTFADEGVSRVALLGWAMTALATMLGAAFWFDLLKRFVNIRAAGPKP